jgi:hypothetical protein
MESDIYKCGGGASQLGVAFKSVNTFESRDWASIWAFTRLSRCRCGQGFYKKFFLIQ